MSQAPFPRRIAFLGDYPPRLCGIATFTHDLCEAISEAVPESECYVGAVNDRPEGYNYPSRVRFELREKDLDSYRRAGDYLNFNNAELLCVQHEFGIYGGTAGSHLLALLQEVRMPVVTTLHTVLQDPSAAQHKVLLELADRSERLVVMAEKGADILKETYEIPAGKIDVIPHGIPDLAFADSEPYKAQFGVEGKSVLLTFGLISPGKGIEHAIQAMAEIVSHHPDAVYLVLGATHPQLLATEGERYRLSLKRLAEDYGVNKHVIFHNRFVELEDLTEFIGATDIYITPYLNEAQITSGTLAYVFGAGKAVISTPYWHARELLDGGRGVLVPFRDSGAIAEAVRRLLEDPSQMQTIRESAYTMGREMVWARVAQRYLETFKAAGAKTTATPRRAFAKWTLDHRPLALPPRRLDHVIRMSDSTGILQHAIYNVPNYHEGYCTDDNARAFILCNLLDELGDEPPSGSLNRLASCYLAFLAMALDRSSGRFRNFMSYSRTWLESAGSEDSHGRALWAAGTGAGRSRDGGHARLSAHLFEQGVQAVVSFTSPRAWAFTLLGIHEYLRRYPASSSLLSIRGTLTNKLITLWRAASSKKWPWFEESLTYENARLSQALILSGQWMPSKDALEIGLKSLRWLASVQTAESGAFRPIGSNGFYTKGESRSEMDQQPVEAQAMVSASEEAFRATRDSSWTALSKQAFDWFMGRNDLGVALYDFTSGGCSDGLHADRVSENQGAESTLAFHLALAEMNKAEETAVTLTMLPSPLLN